MRNSKGFTLIELLIVVVIIGILAAIAIPKFGATKDKAYIAAVKSDLRNLGTAQESYFADNVVYASSTTALGALYSSSAGVTVTVTSTVPGTGWAATAVHSSLPSKPCATFAGTGTAAPAPTPTVEGEIKCTP
jgi:type II secretion system protein G